MKGIKTSASCFDDNFFDCRSILKPPLVKLEFSLLFRIDTARTPQADTYKQYLNRYRHLSYKMPRDCSHSNHKCRCLLHNQRLDILG